MVYADVEWSLFQLQPPGFGPLFPVGRGFLYHPPTSKVKEFVLRPETLRSMPESKILSRFFPWQSIIEYSSASWQEVPEEVVNSEPRLPFGPAHCRWDVSENLRHSKKAVELSCKGIPND